MNFPTLTTPLIAIACALLLTACGAPDPDQNGDNNDNNNDTQPTANAPGELLEGDESRDENPDVDNQTFDDFSTDNRDFSFSIFDELRASEGDDQNIFLSPHSISLALAMTYGGARDNTKTEMSQALHFLLPDDDLHSSFNKLDLELATRSEVETEDEEDVAFALDIVNQTWGHETFPFEQDYLDLLSSNYGAGLYAVDFISNYEEIRADINQWVEDRTQERIKDLLPEGSLDFNTRFILVNAIYFYGSWMHPFDSDLTTDEEFRLLDDSTVEVPMMRHSESINTLYFEDEDTLAISLPYVGDAVSMIAVMPADESADFLAWEANLDRQGFDDAIAGMTREEGLVRFPRFEDEGDYGLVEPFKELGMIDAFNSGLADFTGMYDSTQSPNLFITNIFHKSFVSVDEEGTEAAAATAVVMGVESAPMLSFDVTFDRPFYYAIYDHPTDTILFMGRMVDPS